MLGTPERRDLFLQVLEQTRQRYHFVFVGYVVMPEHIHLLISEPEQGDPSVVMKVVKQEFARTVHRGERCADQSGAEPGKGWQRRFYRFQRMDGAQANREATLYAPQSSEARIGGPAGAMAMEQFSLLCEW